MIRRCAVRRVRIAGASTHGFVYTAPTAGKLRLIANPVSNTLVVQLDLIANESIEVGNVRGRRDREDVPVSERARCSRSARGVGRMAKPNRMVIRLRGG